MATLKKLVALPLDKQPTLVKTAEDALKLTQDILKDDKVRELVSLQQDDVGEEPLSPLQRSLESALRRAAEEGWSSRDVHELHSTLRMVKGARWWAGRLDGALPEDTESVLAADLTDYSFQYAISQALGIKYCEEVEAWSVKPLTYPQKGLIWDVNRRWVTTVVVTINDKTRLVPVKVDTGSPITSLNDSTWYAFGFDLYPKPYTGDNIVRFSKKGLVNGQVLEVHRSVEYYYGANLLGADFLKVLGTRLHGSYKLETFTWGPTDDEFVRYEDFSGNLHRLQADILDLKELRDQVAEGCGCTEQEFGPFKYADEHGTSYIISTNRELKAAYRAASIRNMDLDLGKMVKRL